ncbi:MAG: helical backbone metal receptor [Thermoanaerobaculia bacterium]|nr:helical backbone metal receptor [Thermoanaerobaculia bacterium]
MAVHRIVSLTCSNTEIVAALGCGDRLVGVDDHSDFPADLLSGLPRVGPDLTIDVAAVAALQPDLVLASLTVPGHERVVESIAGAGLPYLAPEPERLDDVYSNIRQIAELLGVSERGDRLVASMQSALDVEPPTGDPDARPKIAVQWWPKPPILPGRRSWVYDLIERAGGQNLLDDDVKSRPLEPEELASLAPDAVVISWCGVEESKYRTDVIYGNAAYAETPFVRGRQIHKIAEAYLGRPAPRLVEGFEALRRIVDQCRRAAR